MNLTRLFIEIRQTSDAGLLILRVCASLASLASLSAFNASSCSTANIIGDIVGCVLCLDIICAAKRTIRPNDWPQILHLCFFGIWVRMWFDNALRCLQTYNKWCNNYSKHRTLFLQVCHNKNIMLYLSTIGKLTRERFYFSAELHYSFNIIRFFCYLRCCRFCRKHFLQ